MIIAFRKRNPLGMSRDRGALFQFHLLELIDKYGLDWSKTSYTKNGIVIEIRNPERKS